MAAEGARISFPTDSLDPTVARLGLVSGLLSRTADPATLDLDTAWFENPLAEPAGGVRRTIRTIPTNSAQREEMLALFKELLGSVSAESLGIPTRVAGRTWYPIRNPAAKPEDQDKATGLYLVTEERLTGEAGGVTETIVGLGAMHTFEFGGVLIEPYIYFPFLRMPPPQQGSTFVLGEAAFPIELGIDVTTTSGRFGTDEVSFDGVKVAATIAFTSDPLRLDLVLLNLKLPGQPAADKNVNDVLGTPANQWIATAVYLLTSQLVETAPEAQADTIRAAVNALLALMGLVGEIPPIDWNAIVKDPAKIADVLAGWLRTIVADQVLLATWLKDGYAFVHGIKPADVPPIPGSGTRADPWRVEVLTIEGNRIDLTVGTVNDKTSGSLLVYPGLALTSKAEQPVAGVAVGVRMQASVEILELTIPPAGGAVPEPKIFPSFHATAVVIDPTAAFRTTILDPADAAIVSIGTLQAGFDYLNEPGGAVRPIFLATDVKTPYGAWPSIDLTNFNEIVQDAGELLANLVVTKLEEFFDVTGSSDAAKMARCCAAVLGVKPPPGYTTEAWPVKQLVLNGPGGVGAVINDPLAALAGYYRRCLTTKNGDGKPAWELLLPSFAGVIGDVGAPERAPSGAGTAEDPWQVQLFGTDPLVPAPYLQSWSADALTSETPTVQLGLAFKVPLPVTAVSMGFSLRGDLVQIGLPNAAGKGSTANWLPDASAEFRVTGPVDGGKPAPLVTPPLGGVSVSSDAFLIRAAWTRDAVAPAQAVLPNSDFFAVIGLLQVKLLDAGRVVENVGDIEFSFTPTSWSVPDLNKFTQLFADAAGLWLLAYGGEFGVTLVSAFGLSPNLSTVFNDPPPGGYPFALPAGVTLSPTWPRLNVKVEGPGSFFTESWRAMRDQLLAVLANSQTALPMMRILGWSVTGTVPPEPVPPSTGTRLDPWSVKLTNFWDLTPLFWTAPANGGAPRLGFGMERTMLAQTAGGVAFDVTARVDASEVDVVSGAAVGAGATLPHGSLIVTIANADPAKPLVDYPATGLQIGSARLGFGIDPAGVRPVLTLLDSRLDAGSPLETIDLTAGLDTTKRTQALETLVYALMKTISPLAASMSGVRSMFDLLAQIELLTPPDATGTYGINLGSWRAMIADPPRFLAGELRLVLEDPARLQAFHRSLLTLVGYPDATLPPLLLGLPDVLVALGLAEHPAGGYALRLSAWIELLRDPVRYLTAQGKRLLDPLDAAVRVALVTALSRLPVPDPRVPRADLPLTIENNTLITLRIPADKLVKVGNALAIEARLVVNVQSLSLATEIVIACPFAGLQVIFSSELAIGAAVLIGASLTEVKTAWGLALSGVVDENVPPPFPPVVFYPLPAGGQVYLQQLAVQIPIVLVSSLATQLVNAFVIGDGVEAKYPLVYRIMNGLGLTIANADPARLRQAQSFLSAMMHPWQWVTSVNALGDGRGGFDLNKIGVLLHDLPGPDGVSGPGDIKLVQDGPTGMKVTGLPFGTSAISFAADAQDGIQIGLALRYVFDTVADERQLRAAGLDVTPQIDLAAHMSFGLGGGVAVSGAATPRFVFDVSDPAKPTTLAITAGYGTKDGFVLTLAGQFDGTSFPPGGGQISFVPFGGLSQFRAGAVALLDFAANQLIKLYDQYKTEPGHNPVVVAIVDRVMGVVRFFGVTSVATLSSTFEQARRDPLAWLVSYFEGPKLAGALTEVVALFAPDALNLPGFASDGTLLTYRPPSVPAGLGALQIQLGQRDATFGVWVSPSFDRDWVTFGATTGVGLTTPLGPSSQLVFTLSTAAGVGKTLLPKQMPGAPTLTLSLSVSTAGQVAYLLRFYPAGVATKSSTLLVQLLPPPPFFAFGDRPDVAVDPLEWLKQFTLAFLVPVTANIVLQTEDVAGWLNAPLLSSEPTSPKPGVLLDDWGLLVEAAAGPPVIYALHDVATMFDDGTGTRLSPLQIVEKLFFVALKGLDGFRLVKIGADGGIYVVSSAAAVARSTDYGLRVMIPDISIWGATPAGAAAKGSTELKVQLGKWLSGHPGCPENWVVESDPALKDSVKAPGVLFYFVRLTTPAGGGTDTLSFHPKLQLISVGVDFAGMTGRPLIDVKGLRVGGVEPRVYFSIEKNESFDMQVGAAIECRAIGVPLGPAQIKGNSGNKNPVAENLLTSGGGEESGGSGSTGSTTNSVNPTFSIDLGYVYDPARSTALYAKLFSDEKTAECSTFIWIPLQRAFGPIHCNQVGFGWEPEPLLDLGFDGSVSLAGLTLDLEHLKVGIPVRTPLDYSKYTLGLDGINVSYRGGPVVISGGFLKTTVVVEGREVVVYSGQALIKAAAWTLGAIGSYALIGQNTPSLFVFAYINTPIGGPPYFFVEGLAAGFGFNRDLDTPNRATAIFEFPFVKGVVDPTYFSGNNADAALQKVSTVSQPMRGAYWLAAGLRFSSFQMIRSFALLTAQFGTDFELNLLGLSTIELPVSVPGGQSYTAIARAEMALLVSFRPSEGLLAVEAALSRNSYVLAKECRLTGGFAFYVWFSPSPHAGEFVVTFGGYHPRFDPPDYYPDEPRVGFSWLMPQYNVTIEGGVYFALLPTAVMAGGYLNLQYRSGNLRAWFSAQADMLVSWKPFYYDVFISVSVGASYKVNLLFVSKTFTIELGAQLNLWGPPTGGKVRVSWWIISFTVSFGPGKESKSPLGWPQFDQSFLPQPKPAPRAAGPHALAAAALPRDPRLSALVPRGLVKSFIVEETGEIVRWVIDPQSFELQTAAQVPLTAATFNGTAITEVMIPIPGTDPVREQRVPIGQANRTLGIVPMAVTGLAATQTITISKPALAASTSGPAGFSALDAQEANELFDVVGLTSSVPKAMWNSGKVNDLDRDTTLANVITGVRIQPKPYKGSTTLPVPADQLEFAAPGVTDFVWGTVRPPTQPQYCNVPACTPAQVIDAEMNALQDAAVLARREQLLLALGRDGVPVALDVDTSLIAKTADQIFLAAPVLAPLGGLVHA